MRNPKLAKLHDDLAHLKDRVKRVFGVKHSVWSLINHVPEISDLTSRSLLVSGEALEIIEEQDQRIHALEERLAALEKGC